ncbi:MAG TPA: gliding motility-associated C-terminal domain-containing protein, partial [Bacteroidales bacterium]|nr:gliding motility-associated C-terminal domain-containing protein [Bacteroidales bacterium]
AGTYHVTITDDHLCTSIQQVVINEPNAIVPGASIQHVNCGTSPGSITLLPQGGTAPFTYLWSTGAVTNAITGLSAGYYEVSITDFNGCTFHDGFQIMASGSNPVVISQTGQILCFGDATGSLSGSMPNGTPLFTYQWSTGGNTAVITGLVAGEYNLTITDAWGCTGSSGKTIDQPGQLNAAVTTVPVSCYGDATGSAQVAISGGVPPYYAAWSSGQSGYQIINMLAGNYQVSVSDHNQCVEVIDFTIAQPSAPLSVLLNITPISCYQDTDGEINAVAQGGTPPYNYYWYNGTSFVNLSTIRFLGQGVYNVTVTDAKGCSTDSLVFLAQPRPLIASYTTTDPSCIGNYDGSILVAVTGGTEPYIYEMNGISYPSSPIDSLYQGDYTVNVVDAHGCEYLLSDIHLEDTFRDCLIIPNAFTPNGDGINDEWVIGNIHLFPRAYIQVFNRWGQILYEGLATEGFWDGTHDGLPVPTGPYMYAIDLLTGANPYIGIVTVVH